MKLLAWDTSSKAGTIVALEWDAASKEGWQAVRLVTELAFNVDSAHSERLLWGIDQVLEAARWTLEQVDVLGVGVGPGSFTGLRIGVTTARTLAHTLKKPLIGVSSLAALVRPAALAFSVGKGARSRAVVVAATDACKGELFCLWGSARSILDCVSLSDGDVPGLWKRGVEEQVLSPDDLIKGIKRKLTEGAGASGWVVVGEGRHRYLEAWKNLPQAKRLDLSLSFPDQIQGRYLGQLVWEAFQAGHARPALDIYPRYLRASDAELKLKAGLLPAGPTRGARGEGSET
ncbi:tRNA (adenosine(37)-N6)-threonylcarbamoyltransferase complex dimerization subunit type 1 TsaB [Bdellovibrionota bacterium FG-1]